MRKTYIKICEMCGNEFEAKGATACYCPLCKVQRKKIAQCEFYDREYFKKRINNQSMKELYEISKHGVNYYDTRKKLGK